LWDFRAPVIEQVMHFSVSNLPQPIPAPSQSAWFTYDHSFTVVVALETYAVTLGQAIAALSPSMFIAAKANPPVIVTLTLFCGVTVPKARLPGFWRACTQNFHPESIAHASLFWLELQFFRVVRTEPHHPIHLWNDCKRDAQFAHRL
jgi:hypothetical protein